MAKLYFYYSAMNAGKSTVLLQSAYNYQERGMDTLIFTPSVDTRYGEGKVTSRIGLQTEAVSIKASDDLFQYARDALAKNANIKCIFVDEAQFLSKAQVEQLTNIVDELNLPVLAYGLRNDYRGETFEGSHYLLIWADNLVEIKTICHCGRKAIMNLRVDANGKAVRDGSGVHIGGNESYIAMCRRHFKGAE